ncbi:MAG TPA: hypothetical protein VGV37_25025 [Aliidongia sp.]|uniref:hypothetical protein n=1 Tax=Aliidongia sp. TaxID=1914230 RepID=UPI002DDD36D2|nr:hypothetical protein [Aliidongia sp.]HEV2677819.1 hypothetical protein [Aliidongia sp.]
MPRYRFYIIDENDHVTGRHEIQYLDDELAIIGAADEFPGEDVEIWDGARCILTVARDALMARPDLHRPIDVMV